jgi:hypothetical protein
LDTRRLTFAEIDGGDDVVDDCSCGAVEATSSKCCGFFAAASCVNVVNVEDEPSSILLLIWWSMRFVCPKRGFLRSIDDSVIDNKRKTEQQKKKEETAAVVAASFSVRAPDTTWSVRLRKIPAPAVAPQESISTFITYYHLLKWYGIYF